MTDRLRRFNAHLRRNLRRSVRVDPREFAALARTLGKWLLLGSGVGALAGLASAVVLLSLEWATQFRTAHPLIILALPVAGALLGWFYQRFAGIAAQGNNLIIDEIHANQRDVPLRMAPMILVLTGRS